MLATFSLLTLALVALWLPVDAEGRRPFAGSVAWLSVLGAALIAALVNRIIAPIGLLWVAMFAAAAWDFSNSAASRGRRSLAAVAIVLLAAGLMTHRLPGFNNPRVIAGTRFGTGAIPYALYLNFDKPLIGLFLLGWCHERIRSAEGWRAMFTRAAPIAGALILVIMMLALSIGYVRFEPKFPREGWLWAWANLFLTCIAEEALFRGFVQAQLQEWWRSLRHGASFALIVAALLFGVAHAAGGMTYVALASVAGLGYGWAYRRSGGRIEASILTHFALNATHFLLFTYPALSARP